MPDVKNSAPKNVSCSDQENRVKMDALDNRRVFPMDSKSGIKGVLKGSICSVLTGKFQGDDYESK